MNTIRGDLTAKGVFTICGTLKEREAEIAYRQSQAHLIGRQTLATALIATLVFFGSLLYDYLAFPVILPFGVLVAIRIGGLLAGLWLAYEAYRYRDITRSRMPFALIFFELYVVLGFLVIVLAHGGNTAFHTMSAMAIVLAYFIFFPNFTHTQFLIPPLFTLVFLACAYLFLDSPAGSFPMASIILLLVNGLGWQFARLSNQTRRQEYQNLKTQQALNDELRAEITERRHAEDSLQRLFDAAPMPMVLTREHDGAVLQVNKLAQDLFNIHPGEIDNIRAPDFYINLQQRDELFARINAVGRVRAMEVMLKTSEGKRFDGLLSANQIEYEGDRDCVFLGIMDITELNHIKEELEHLANVDMLTGVNNRRAFFVASERELRRRNRERNSECLSVMLLDIDKFKRINDNFGHAMGDRVLKAVAQRLQENIREFDILGRIGGEEFAILLPGLGLDAAREVAERIRQSIQKPIIDSGMDEPLLMTVSAGVAEVPEDATVIDKALNRADRAMYEAKHKGRNRIEVTSDTADD